MESRIRFAGHPAHPFLVHLPIGLFIGSLIMDIVGLITGHVVWAGASCWTMVMGAGFALIAAVPGFIDYMFLDLSYEVRRVATYHMVLNLTVVALFIADILWRVALFPRTPGLGYYVPIGPFVLSVIGIVLLSISGYLGGQLVYSHHVGVTEPEYEEVPGRRSFRSPERRAPIP